jgi:preprotein translocase subunit YajC
VLLLVAAIYFFVAVPVRRRQHAHAAMQDDVIVGDEIITAGGMHAIVKEAGESELRIEIAPGIVVTLDRRAVAAIAQEIEVDAEGEREESPKIAPEADMDDQGAR